MEQNVILYVLSNLKHNATQYTQGSFITGALSEFEALVKDGVLRVVEGATSEEEAAKIIADETEAAKEKGAAVVSPKNTWGPTDKPADVAETTTETTTESTDATGKVDTTETTGEALEVGKGDVAPVDDTNL